MTPSFPLRGRRTLLLLLSCALAAASAFAGGGPEGLRHHIEALASPDLEGRLTGSDGARTAADYLAERLGEMGARPLPGQTGFKIGFEFTAGTTDTGTSLTVGDASFGEGEVRALSFSEEGIAEGDLVFAGYGLKVPDSQDFGYDSYATLDVEGKIVVVLRYFPEDAEPDHKRAMARYSGLRYKALTAREAGAKAIIVVAGPRSPNAGELVPMTFDTAASGSGIPAATITGAIAERLIASAGKGTLEEIQAGFDTGNPHAAGFDLGTTARLDIRIEREKRRGFNVAGALGAVKEVDKPFVVLGAHYDHLGRGRMGNSLLRGDEGTDIHHGADDNASGVAAVLEAGRLLAEQQLDRAIVLTFWSGEELGLLGSADFVDQGTLPPAELLAYLNFDMVGRMRDNRLTLQALGSSPVWRKLIEQANVMAGFDLQTQEDPYLPTDSTSFNKVSVPSINFFTGSHDDYHRPSDLPEKINYEDLDRVVDFAAKVASRLANLSEPPEFVEVERKREEGGGRDTVRAYTGTIPDYTSEVEGLLLGGVMAGGPADEAGLRQGDVIVEFAGQTIANIYDYTYALDAVKIDVPIEVVVVRGDERVTLTLVPRARK